MTTATPSGCIAVLERPAAAVGGLDPGDATARLDRPKSGVRSTLARLGFHDLGARVLADVLREIRAGLARRATRCRRVAAVEGESLASVSRATGAVAGPRCDADRGQEVALHATAKANAWLTARAEAVAALEVVGRWRARRRDAAMGGAIAHPAAGLRQQARTAARAAAEART